MPIATHITFMLPAKPKVGVDESDPQRVFLRWDSEVMSSILTLATPEEIYAYLDSVRAAVESAVEKGETA